MEPCEMELHRFSLRDIEAIYHQRKSLQANIVNAAPTSRQDDDKFNFADFFPTKEGILLMSSAAPISLQDSDTPQDSDTSQDSDTLQDSDASDRGDFVNSKMEEIDVDAATEDLERYASGLCYPISIGEVLIHTYRIEHKLRHDDFSTVWLARDIRQKRDVALKIMIPGDAGDYECSMQKKIMNTVQDTSNLVTYLTSFSLPGYKGNHQVLVFPVRGPNFSSVMLNQISLVNRMSAARQLLKALECLHNANIVHNSE